MESEIDEGLLERDGIWWCRGEEQGEDDETGVNGLVCDGGIGGKERRVRGSDASGGEEDGVSEPFEWALGIGGIGGRVNLSAELVGGLFDPVVDKLEGL